METIENFAKSWNPTTRLVERDGGRTSLRESLQYSLLLLRRDKADIAAVPGTSLRPCSACSA